MLKGVKEQVGPMETSGRSKKVSSSRDMLSTLEAKLEGSMGDVRKTLEIVEGRIDELDLIVGKKIWFKNDFLA